jgi:hypothetical protein
MAVLIGRHRRPAACPVRIERMTLGYRVLHSWFDMQCMSVLWKWIRKGVVQHQLPKSQLAMPVVVVYSCIGDVIRGEQELFLEFPVGARPWLCCIRGQQTTEPWCSS